jgi:zinc protease
MGFLLDSLDDTKFRAQRDIVKNERRQNTDNEPYARENELLGNTMYPKGHPYSWPTIGSMADLGNATVEDVKKFFRLYYAPNNATLVIVGISTPRVPRPGSRSTSARFSAARRSFARTSVRMA